jgi:hypothetical protein
VGVKKEGGGGYEMRQQVGVAAADRSAAGEVRGESCEVSGAR